MKDEYDFSQGKRGAIATPKGKTRITIYLDNDILTEFRERAEQKGIGYQTLINQALKAQLKSADTNLPYDEIQQIVERTVEESLRQISSSGQTYRFLEQTK